MRPIRRAQILAAAIEVIARETFCGTTIQKVADAAGVSTGTVNHYFDNKLTLLMATLEQASLDWRDEQLEAVESSAPGEPRLEALIISSGPSTPTKLLRWKVWIAAWSEALRSPELRLVLADGRDVWMSLLTQQLTGIARELGRPDLDCELLAREYDALQNGLYIRVITANAAVDDTLLGILRAFLRGRLGLGSSDWAIGKSRTQTGDLSASVS